MKTDTELRELDAEMAVIMGHVDVGFFCHAGHGVVPRNRIVNDEHCPWCGAVCQDELPHYTTSPADAMQVLKKCGEKCDLEDSSIIINVTNGTWDVMRQDSDGEVIEISDGQPTLELAICQFAKRLHESLNQKEK